MRIVKEKKGKLLHNHDKKGTAFIFMYKIDENVLFSDLIGASLAPLNNLKYMKMTP